MSFFYSPINSVTCNRMSWLGSHWITIETDRDEYCTILPSCGDKIHCKWQLVYLDDRNQSGTDVPINGYNIITCPADVVVTTGVRLPDWVTVTQASEKHPTSWIIEVANPAHLSIKVCIILPADAEKGYQLWTGIECIVMTIMIHLQL